ncbi:CPBP family glutamic-type intramembrane protease [Flavobacterium nitrogenifigens]|uniref:CPBP family glutamic-type intramembrane protease n=2 Tax=Flavobacterium nitrogenifigens TaxID=1617283 RepID=UPI00359400E6
MKVKKIKRNIFFWLISLVFFFAIKIMTSLLITIIFKSDLNNKVVNEISNSDFVFVLSVVFAPIIETFIFFKLTLMGLDYFKKNEFVGRYKVYLFVLISSLLFSVNHCYNVSYLISAFISGVLYSLIYYKSFIKKNYPFIGTVIIHSLYNLFVFCYKL